MTEGFWRVRPVDCPSRIRKVFVTDSAGALRKLPHFFQATAASGAASRCPHETATQIAHGGDIDFMRKTTKQELLDVEQAIGTLSGDER
jgi:hypothetical protein